METFFTAPASLHNRHYEKFADGRVKDIEDEIPFAVPEGWAWCRLPNLCKIPITDGTHQTPTYSDKEHGIPFLSSKDVTSRKIDWSKIKYITKELHEELQKRIQPSRNDILLAKNGTTGVAALVDTDKIFDIYVTLAVLRPAEVVHPNYLHYVINSPFCKKQFNGHLTGIGVPNLHLNDICKTIIPLPPLSEQKRIVTAIEAIFAQIDLMEQNKANLHTAVKQAKSKILDLAIRGKLVPQDPADEPASVMLEKLRAEKEAKIAAGEIKRGKNDSYIYKNSTDNCYYEKFGGKSDICIDDEIPFELPANWQWCRFGNYIDVRDGTHDSPKYVETGYPFITSKNLINGKIDFSNVQYITEKDHNNYIQRSYVEDDDILFAMIGSIGNPVLIKKDREFSIKNVALFKPYEKKHTDMKFVLFFLSWIQEYLRKIAKGGMQPFIPLNLFRKEIFIPIPPISEQKRIITKIEEIFKALDGIQRNLI